MIKANSQYPYSRKYYLIIFWEVLNDKDIVFSAFIEQVTGK